MRRVVRSAGGWCTAVCIAGLSAWGCSGADTNPFTEEPQGGQSGTSGVSTGGTTSGSSSGGNSTAGSESGGTSGSNTGGDATGGVSAGGTIGDGGAAADAGSDSGGSTTGGAGTTGGTAGSDTGGAGMGGTAGTPMGGAGMSGAGAGGAGTAGGGTSGSGGTPGDCKLDSDCNDGAYCKKATCDAETGNCTPLGPDCYGDDSKFAPVCGCDGTTFWNTCVLEHAGMNAASDGECTGNNRPTCTRADGGGTCPSGGDHARCYRPVEVCGDTSPLMGHCWVLPEECPDDEPQTTRYCGGTDGDARCIGFCEVLAAENSFRRDASICE